jgi:hypothetical protein
MKRLVLLTAALAAEPAYAGKFCGTVATDSNKQSQRATPNRVVDDTSWTNYRHVDGNESHQPTGCEEDTDVVGFRHCTKYGEWAKAMRLPKLFVELGSNFRQFSSGLASRTQTVEHGAEQFTFKTVMSPTEAASAEDIAVTTALRLGTGITRNVYAGAELEIGGLVSPAAASAEMMTSGAFGTPAIEQQRGLELGALGVAGYRVASGRSTVAVEAAGGVRSARYHYGSTYHNCVETATIVQNSGVVEARARVETWLGPWVTAGATIGGSVIARGDWMGGVFIGFHTRAFGGAR